MNSIYLCYKRSLTSIIAASLVFEKLRNNGYAVIYSRKLRKNDYIQNIDNVLEDAEDVIVLLDDHSFLALNEGVDRFLESWFCRELLEAAKQNKHIIVICLNGYTLPEKSVLPPEIQFLYDSQIQALDIFNLNTSPDIEEFIGELKAKPVLKYFQENRVSYAISSDFLIYSDSDCNIYEYGYLIATLDSNVDKHHPFKYTVNRSGQHCFFIINNDTGQTQEICSEIVHGSQKYIHIKWKPSRTLASLKEEDLKKETDGNLLYTWGKGFFFGNTKRKADYNMSLLCFLRAAELGNQKAVEFIRKYDHSLASIFKVPKDVVERWYNKAAEFGSPEAWMKMGEIKELQGKLLEAISCYEKALEYGHTDAVSAIERCQLMEQKRPNSQQNKFIKDFHAIVQNFERQAKSGRTGKHGRAVDFTYVVANLKKIETLFTSEENKNLVNYFESDSPQPKYSNRFYGLLGDLAKREIFDTLSHKDILDICVDETGENKSDVSDFIRRMGGKASLNPANISKMSDRIITGGIKKMLDKAMTGKL